MVSGEWFRGPAGDLSSVCLQEGYSRVWALFEEEEMWVFLHWVEEVGREFNSANKNGLNKNKEKYSRKGGFVG